MSMSHPRISQADFAPAVAVSVGSLLIDGSRTFLMGVLNCTPDSFADGGRYERPEVAISHGEKLFADGADILDVGGESTRPGSSPVTSRAEMDRVLPVIEALRSRTDRPLSIDTTKAEVAAAACAAGADMVNDISGLTMDPELASVVAEAGAALVIGHIRGNPRTMQDDPRYEDVLVEVGDALEASVDRAIGAGVRRDGILVDPGIGFGKSLEGNLELLRGLGTLRARLGLRLMVGASRKSFIGALTGAGVADRLPGTIAAHVLARAAGADMVRAHDVAEARQAALVADALLGGWGEG
ncbi:MAG: dihydropteroate synthase [Polyangia bacterium]|jgi:dihydropteroate synthase|nr:dihydropteroate synthase [Polyangia bacterium]